MIYDLTGIVGIAITAVLSAAALKKYAPETSVVITISAGIIILLSVLSKTAPVIEQINSFVSSAEIDSTYAPVLIKTVGICFLCQFTADSCRDCGQSSLASKVELASKISIIVTALPLFENILNTAVGLIESYK